MHGPPITIDEIAALLEREIAALRRLGASLEKATKVVAERHRVPSSTVAQLLLRRRRHEPRSDFKNRAAA